MTSKRGQTDICAYFGLLEIKCRLSQITWRFWDQRDLNDSFFSCITVISCHVKLEIKPHFWYYFCFMYSVIRCGGVRNMYKIRQQSFSALLDSRSAWNMSGSSGTVRSMAALWYNAAPKCRGRLVMNCKLKSIHEHASSLFPVKKGVKYLEQQMKHLKTAF